MELLVNRTSLVLIAALAGLVTVTPQAQAAGCLKGAFLGGIAGHFAHHTLLGAISGCMIGHVVSGHASNFTYGDLGVLLGAGNAGDEWTAIEASRKVEVIKASDLKGYVNHDAKLQSAIARNSEIKGLDARIAADTVLTGKLRAAGAAPSEIIAAVADKDATAYFFVNR
jgi:hypothetical protein